MKAHLSSAPFAGRLRIISVFSAIFFLLLCLRPAFSESGRASDEAFSFIAISDTHLGAPEATGRFERIVQHVNFRRPAFLIICGDNVDVDSVEQWEEFKRLTSKLEVPLYTAIGNHDSYLSDKLYKKYRGKLFYSFDYGNSHFIVLDNAQKFNNATLFVQPGKKMSQWNWLSEDIAKPAAHKFVFFHFPVYGNRGMLDPQYMPHTTPEEREKEVARMIKLFKENGVEYVVFGHLHSYERTERDGITHLRLGGGGGSRASETDEKDVGFAQFFVGPDGVTDTQVYVYGTPASLVFVNPPKSLRVGEAARLTVDGVDAAGRHVGMFPEFSVTGGVGEISPAGVFTAKRAGKGALTAKSEGHEAVIYIEVK